MTSARAFAAVTSLAALMFFPSGSPVAPARSARPVEGANLPSAVVVRVEHEGGFLTPERRAVRFPFVSVYADGRVISEGPRVARYPPAALPNLQLTRISVAQVNTLVGLALAAGAGTAADLGAVSIADVESTRFTVLTPTGPRTTVVAGLDEGADPKSGLTTVQLASRTALQVLQDQLTDVPGTLGSSVTSVGSYLPARLAVVFWSWRGDAGMPAQRPMRWPGPGLSGSSMVGAAGLSCVVLSGSAMHRVLRAAGSARSTTPWISGGRRWTVAFRPLLPDQRDCRGSF